MSLLKLFSHIQYIVLNEKAKQLYLDISDLTTSVIGSANGYLQILLLKIITKKISSDQQISKADRFVHSLNVYIHQ